MKRVATTLVAVCVVLVASAAAGAQTGRGVVLDQTGLPLPGATVQLLNGPVIVATVTSGPDGTFALGADLPGDVVVASLDGFETARVARGEAGRIVLDIAHTTETTTVVAPAAAAASPAAALLGTTLTATNVARLPSSKMRAKESLPLLPSVMRGPDGLLQLGGARAHDTPLFIDGFNVTDPATGISNINLPFESVRGVDVLRDPMAITYGGLIAGVVKMESNPGGDSFKMGVQGVVPRPRFASPGFGRLEGIFPRFFAAGPAAGGRVHYFTTVEYDYERIPVPEVTQGRGPDIVEESATFFTRVDAKINDRQAITIEGLAFPSRSRNSGLSPRREEVAAADLSSQDLFAGITHRFVRDQATVFTIQIGALVHDASLTPKGSGASFVSPAGWRGNWFAAASRTALRYTAVATWEHIKTIRGRTHDFTMSGEVASRRLRGEVEERPIVVENTAGQVVRVVESGPRARFAAHDRPVGMALRDVWSATGRLQVDLGARIDHSRHGGGRPSGRVGARYVLDDANTTVVKVGFGSFVGSLPLGVPAFAGYPERIDRRLDPESGEVASEIVLQPAIGAMRLPHARAATVGLERQLAPRLDAQVVFTDRQSRRLATLSVPRQSGPLMVASTGSGHYREMQVAVRRTWEHDQQLFLSYVRSSARGELNDFAALFHAIDAPLVQPGGMARLTSDARHRLVAWGTFNLPSRIVLSPVTEWRSGFLYSPLDERYTYASTPNSRSFPAFLATDLVIYRTFTVRGRSADVGMQLFNATNHRNPRDVYAMTNGPRYGQFANSVGPIVRGYMLVKW
jgi:carboxypeptidase family protein